MAVVGITSYRVNPDATEAHMQWSREVKAFLERAGASVRLLAAVVAGEATGRMAFVTEAADFASIGSITDQFMTDPQIAAAMAKATSLYSEVSTTQWIEIPLD